MHNWINLLLAYIKVWSDFVCVLWGVIGLWVSSSSDLWTGWISNSSRYTSQSIHPIVGTWDGICYDDHKLTLVSSSKWVGLWVSLLGWATCEQIWTIF